MKTPNLATHAARAPLLGRLVLIATLLATPWAWAQKSNIPASQRQALLDIYNSTKGTSGWAFGIKWEGATGGECFWTGVTCDSSLTTVVAVDISGFIKTQSTLPHDVFTRLPDLTSIRIGANYGGLVDTVPDLSGLTKLTNFEAFNDALTVLPVLTNLPSLQYIDIGGNRIVGAMPDLTALTSLRELRANDNLMTGLSSLNGLVSLQAFSANANRLGGAIPPLAGLSKLQRFDVSNNQLTGPVPEISGLPELVSFDASSNHLDRLPNTLSGAPKLVTFDVSGNDITGSIPAPFDLPSLSDFNVGSNRLTGTIPALSGLPKINGFHVDYNLLTGAVPPGPNTLGQDGSGLCPNPLTPSADAEWDFATGQKPWYAECGYTVGGTVSGLSGSGLVLTLNDNVQGQGDSLDIAANGAFTFSFILADGAAYVVKVQTQPTGPAQACQVKNGAGTIAKASVIDIAIDCGGGSGTTNYTIATIANPTAGGSVSCNPNPVSTGGTSTCTAQPSTNYTFTSFSGDCTGAICTLNNVTANKTVTANFSAAPPTKSTTTTALSLTPNPVSVSQTLTATVAVNVASGGLLGAGATSPASKTPALASAAIVGGGGQNCTAPLNSSGAGSCTLSFAAPGNYAITANYPGDAQTLPSSDTQNLTVNAAVTQPAAPVLDRWALLLLAMALGGFVWRARRGA